MCGWESTIPAPGASGTPKVTLPRLEGKKFSPHVSDERLKATGRVRSCRGRAMPFAIPVESTPIPVADGASRELLQGSVSPSALLLWGCRFWVTAMGVVAHEAKIPPCGAVGMLCAIPLGSCSVHSSRMAGLPASIPACLFISFTIQYSQAALSLLYIYQYYQLIAQSLSVGLLILPSDLWEAATLYIPAPSPAPPSPHAMFN